MKNESRDLIKQKMREKELEKAVELCAEITLSKDVEELFELAKTDREQLEKKVSEFENSSLWKKIQRFDNSFKTKPIFKKKSGSQKIGLLDYDTRINPKALFFLIASMDRHTEDSFFEDPNDLVVYLKNIGEKQIASYVEENWLFSTIANILWDIYDKED